MDGVGFGRIERSIAIAADMFYLRQLFSANFDLNVHTGQCEPDHHFLLSVDLERPCKQN